MHAHTPPSLVVNLDDYDGPADALDALLLGEFVAGAYPASCSVHVPRTREDARLLPDGVTPDRIARSSGRWVHLARGDGWLLKAARWNDGSAEVTVIATSDALAQEIAASAAASARDDDATPETEPVAFWYVNGSQPRRIVRRVAVPAWPVIERNYTRPVAHAMTTLHAVTPDRLRGRIGVGTAPEGSDRHVPVERTDHGATRRVFRPCFVARLTLGFRRGDR
jgi:hypothetical protein